MMRLLRGVLALVVLTGAIVGAPLALSAWGWYPSDWTGLLRPDDGSLLLVVLTGVGWLAWLAFTVSTLVESVRLLAGVNLRVPLLGGLQQVSAGLLFAVLALVPSSTPAAPADAPALTIVAHPIEPEPTSVPAVEAESSDEAASDGYLVAAGDDLWSVAESLLGDGSRWRELVAANPEALHDPTARLAPGSRLALPASAATPKPAPEQVVVERGDTLSGLALEHLDTAKRWPAIAAANADLIDDPDHIEIGWRLDLPAAHHSARGADTKPQREDRGSPATADSTPEAADPQLSSDSVPEPAGRQLSPGSVAEPAERPVSPDSVAEPAERPVSPGSVPEELREERAERHEGPPAVSESAEGSRSAPTAPVEGPPSPATVPELVEGPSSAEPNPEPAAQPGLPTIGVIGSLAAAAVIGVLETRRYLRLRSRPPGRRLLPAPESAIRLRTAIGTGQRPDRMAALDAAMRAIGEHCHRHALPLPEVERVMLGEAELGFHWATPAGAPPSGFSGDADAWRLTFADAALAPSDWPCPYPALVSLGTAEAGATLLVDAERSRVLGVAAGTDELRRSALAAMGVELACAPWSQDLPLVAVGDDTTLLSLAGGERVRVVPSLDQALHELRAAVAARRRALAGEPLASLRVDPDRAEAVVPLVYLLNTAITQQVATELDDLLAGPAAGVVVLVGTDSAAPALWHVGGDPYAPSGRLTGSPGSLLAHSIPEATRAGVASLFTAADDPADAPAPWWGDPTDNVRPLPQRALRGEDPMDIVRLLPAADAPMVLLIGPSDLVGAKGAEPLRSRQQLVEACAWLLEHPGRSATEMSAGLAVAEGTRRSNLSRLRAWLGADASGELYLPDAYSGRIRLHPHVTSDWEHLQLLLRPGADRVADSVLVAALELVRGAPLADAAPGQWHWAEELRTDVTSALRDVGLVLADRALANGDIDLARWAASRALVVAPEDEQLLCVRVRTEHRAGNRPEVERLVNQLARQARLLGVDLLPETVELCQQAIEGRLRAQQA